MTSLRSLQVLLITLGSSVVGGGRNNDGKTKGTHTMLTVGMVVLGLATFAAMIGFVTLCDRV